jgi:hypothetical protein
MGMSPFICVQRRAAVGRDEEAELGTGEEQVAVDVVLQPPSRRCAVAGRLPVMFVQVRPRSVLLTI